MKLKAAQVETFLRAPDAKAQLVLIYGEDEGLVRERAVKLAKTVVEDLKDPFRVIEMGSAQLKEDSSRLRDEAAAISFGGGRRVIRLRDIGDAQAPAIADFLKDPAGDALIVIEAGSLPSRSKLRQAVEKAGNGMALPCYADGGRDLEGLISAVMDDHKLRIDRDATRYLVANLGSDRMISRSELEKLALYALKDGQVTLADAMDCVGDSSARHYDDVIQAVSQGNVVNLDTALTRLTEEGLNPVGAHDARIFPETASGQRTDHPRSQYGTGNEILAPAAVFQGRRSVPGQPEQLGRSNLATRAANPARGRKRLQKWSCRS